MRLWSWLVRTRARRMRAALALCVFLASLFFGVLSHRRGQSALVSVQVSAWDRCVLLRIPQMTVSDALLLANVALGPTDVCDLPLDALVEDGQDINVTRGSVAFVRDGDRVWSMLVACETVGSALGRAEVSVGDDDVVWPELEETVLPFQRIDITRVTLGIVSETVSIGYPTERREDPSMEAGIVKTLRQGEKGTVKVSWTVRYEDGVEVSRTESSREEVSAPVPEILAYGALREVSRGEETFRFTKVIEATTTAYCPCTKCCGPTASGLTHTGIPAKRGVVAVDPKVIPLGSRVYVDGYGYAIAADIGGAIKGNRVDVCFDTHEEAERWGMKKAKVYVIE